MTHGHDRSRMYLAARFYMRFYVVSPEFPLYILDRAKLLKFQIFAHIAPTERVRHSHHTRAGRGGELHLSRCAKGVKRVPALVLSAPSPHHAARQT